MIRAIVFLLLLSSSAYCQTQFYVSPAGNDASTGTLLLPWKTVQFALDNSVPGCTIYLMGGTYQENVNATISGTAGNYITLTNYNNQVAIIDGTSSSGGPLLYLSGIQYFKVIGIEFANYTQNDAQGILIDGSSSNIQIQNNKIHDIHFSSNASDVPNANTNAQPLIVYGDNASNAITNLTISGNEIFNCRTGFSEGLAVNGNVDGFTVFENKVHDNSNIGIDIIGHEGTSSNPSTDQARNGIISWNNTWNNVSSYATSGGIYVDGAKDCIIENNTCFGNGWGIEIGCEAIGQSTDNITVRNNLVYRNLEGGIVIGGYDYPSNSGKVVFSSVHGNTIAENHISSNSSGELIISYTENCTFKSNLVYTSSNDFLVGSDANSTFLVLDFNLYYSTTSTQFSYNSNVLSSLVSWRSNSGGDFTSLQTDPLLVNPISNNYHLTANSPAIDHGDSSYIPLAGETDIDTMSRRQNARVDIGADEFGTAVGIQETELEQSEFKSFDFSNSQITIDFKKPLEKNSIIYLYDDQGRLLAKKEVKKGDNTVVLDIQRAAGIYFIKMNRSVLKIVL